MSFIKAARSYAQKNENLFVIKLLRLLFVLLKRRELEISILSITSTFPEFVPYSAGSYSQRAKCTIEGIKSIFPVLLNFQSEINPRLRLSTSSPIKLLNWDKLKPNQEEKQLADLFCSFGSDKSISHNYHVLYANLFNDRFAVNNVLEIGIGSKSSSILSNMGRNGMPGASLRAFSKFFPNAMIIGLDYDRSILFTSERIRTYFVNQLNPATFDEIEELKQASFDLIVDDGLHLPTANLITMQKLLRKLRPGGWFVVEDIGYAAVDIWRFVMGQLPLDYSASLIETKSALVFVVNRQLDKGGLSETAN